MSFPRHTLTVALYAGSAIGVELLFVLVAVVVGLIIFKQRSSDIAGLFAALVMMAGAQATETYGSLAHAYPSSSFVMNMLGSFGC